jgi:cobaltochelatase CobT
VPGNEEAEQKLFTKIAENMQGEVATMTSALEQELRAMTRCRKDQFLRHGRVDSSRLVEIAKNLSKDLYFQIRNGKELDTAVSFVIDQSGSMKRQIAEIRDLVILLGECMNRLGIPFEIVGTTTKYNYGSSRIPAMGMFTRTNPIVYTHFKDFDENWTVIRPRMVHMQASSHNIDGEAVEYAAKRISQRRETRKIVFSLCDGEPCGGQSKDGQLGQNIIDVVKHIRAAGIEVFGVGIGVTAPARYYGKEFFISLSNLENKGQQFVAEFSRILTNGKLVR